MANKVVFLDRDRTLMEDPGYLSDPKAVRLLPGVELAIKSLAQGGYKIIVVTNQSGIARGLLTEADLQKVHAELRRQLAEKGAHLDGVYYCPYHQAGTVEGYAIDSDLRKPRPGMLLKAAREMDIDLGASWMVGDSPHDIGAGRRAGCKTVRIRTGAGPSHGEDEDVSADHTVRNLVDAARVILRRPPAAADEAADEAAAQVWQPGRAVNPATMDDGEVRREIFRHLRHLDRASDVEEFSFTKLIAGIVQVFALLALLIVFWMMLSGSPAQQATLWALIAVVLQVMALTFFMMHRSR